MKARNSLIILLLVTFLISISFYSCKENPPTIAPNLLYGDWEIVEAIRNKKPIKTLKDGTFSFKADKPMSTNIMGDEAFYPFELNDNEIDQLDGDMFLLKIQKLSKDTLILTSIIRNDEFYFTLTPLEGENSN